MPREKKRALWKVVQQRMGFKQGARVLEFIMLWGLCQAELERPPVNVEEYVRWWEGEISTSTGYRQLRLFRECFEAEGFDEPTDLFHALGIVPGEFSVRTMREAKLA